MADWQDMWIKACQGYYHSPGNMQACDQSEYKKRQRRAELDRLALWKNRGSLGDVGARQRSTDAIDRLEQELRIISVERHLRLQSPGVISAEGQDDVLNIFGDGGYQGCNSRL